MSVELSPHVVVSHRHAHVCVAAMREKFEEVLGVHVFSVQKVQLKVWRLKSGLILRYGGSSLVEGHLGRTNTELSI